MEVVTVNDECDRQCAATKCYNHKHNEFKSSCMEKCKCYFLYTKDQYKKLAIDHKGKAEAAAKQLDKFLEDRVKEFGTAI